MRVVSVQDDPACLESLNTEHSIRHGLTDLFNQSASSYAPFCHRSTDGWLLTIAKNSQQHQKQVDKIQV